MLEISLSYLINPTFYRQVLNINASTTRIELKQTILIQFFIELQ